MKILQLEPRKEISFRSSVFIAGRYGDEKFEFYRKYNKKDVAEKYLNVTKELSVWLKNNLKKITNMVMNYSDRLSKKESVSIKKMFIFGSVSKGKNTKNSDVDVCIVSPFLIIPLKQYNSYSRKEIKMKLF